MVYSEFAGFGPDPGGAKLTAPSSASKPIAAPAIATQMTRL